MTDKTKPVSASNPPESKGTRTQSNEKTNAEILRDAEIAMKNVEGSHVNFTKGKKTTKEKGS